MQLNIIDKDVTMILVPLQSWGGGFNFSIWHVQLWGIAEGVKVEDALTNLVQVKNRYLKNK